MYISWSTFPMRDLNIIHFCTLKNQQINRRFSSLTFVGESQLPVIVVSPYFSQLGLTDSLSLPLQPRSIRGHAEAAAELPLADDVSVPFRLNLLLLRHIRLRVQGDAPLSRRDRQQPQGRAQETAQEETDRHSDHRWGSFDAKKWKISELHPKTEQISFKIKH